MHFPDALTPSRPRLLLIALALVAALAAASLTVATGEVRAASGGIAADDDGRSTKQSKDRGTTKYARLWDRVSRKDKRWARKTSDCESGRDPDAIGGGGRYRGAFQFMKATWRTSPKSPGGDPIAYSYKTQAVVAVALKRRDGDGHWPVCG